MKHITHHVTRDPITAEIIAQHIDRLAYTIDPYEYFDVVGRTEDDTRTHVETITADIMADNIRAYTDWLAELADDDNAGHYDRLRAAYLLDRLNAWTLAGMKKED